MNYGESKVIVFVGNYYYRNQEKKEEIWLSVMTKVPIPTETS